MSSSGRDADREQRLDEAAAEYFQRQASGKPVDREQWLGQYPDLADELGGFLDDLDELKPNFVWSKTIVAGAAIQWRDSLPATELEASPRLRRYQLRKSLAQGGMGEVWLADDLHVGRQIAVKKIRDARRASPFMEEKFLLESQIMGQLEHPCIVPLHDLGRNEAGELYAVMKLVRGASLKQHVQEFHASKTDDDWPRQIDFRRLLEVFLNICHAVAYAHSRGVLHRDIKPDNIMLGSYGEALLLDWGLAKALHRSRPTKDLRTPCEPVSPSAGNSTTTRAGSIMGSPAYMPPEMAAGRSDAADERTDIYLLGATLYEILTGKPPRSGSSQAELIDLALANTPLQPRRIDRRLPKALEAICLRAMAADSRQRYDSAAALAREIENYLAGEPVAAYREPIAFRIRRWCKRHRRVMQRTVVGLSLLTLIALSWFSHRRAGLLEQREAARQQLASFRELADETRYFAANTDAVAEHAPYFDTERAIQLGHDALEQASRWEDLTSGSALPGERAEFESELFDLLLLLANLHQQSAATLESQARALALLDRAAALGPGSRALHQIRARCLRQLGATAEADVETVRALQPDMRLTAQDFFLEGENHRVEGAGLVTPGVGRVDSSRPEAVVRAIAAYEHAVRVDPKHYWAHFQLARCYLRTQRGPEAVSALGTCIALRPEFPWAYGARGLVYGLLGQFQQAESDLKQALALAPEFRPARLNRGFVHFLQKNDREALGELAAVLQPPAESVLIEAAYYRAVIHCQHGNLAAARRDCETFLAQRPDFAPAHFLLAQIHLRNGDDSRGLASIDALLSCNYRSTLDSTKNARLARGQALREIAVTLDRASQRRALQLALTELEAVGGSAAEQDLTAVKDLMGPVEQVVTAYTERLSTAPDDIMTRKKRGWDYVKLRRCELAAADFEAAIQQAPGDAEAHAGLGYARAVQGERAASEVSATRALLHGAQSFLVLHNVACIYAELAGANASEPGRRRDEDLALTLLQQAVALARQSPGGVDEVELIRAEPAFHPPLKGRPEFQKLLQ